MEIQFDKKSGGRKKNDTRMYAPSQGRKRVTFGPADAQTRRQNGDDRQTDESTLRSGRQEGETRGITRFGLVLCTFAFAGMLLFMLSGYEKITRAYQEINNINSQIEEAELTINALEVAIECAVTIDQAQEWAKAHNMQYPLQSQYVASGSAIPVSGAPADTPGTAGSAPEAGSADAGASEALPTGGDLPGALEPGA